MDFVPYVCPWAPHFLLIGHFAVGFVSSPQLRLVPVNIQVGSQQTVPPPDPAIDYLYNTQKTQQKHLALAKSGLFCGLLELYNPCE
jgi:hypothetical protein